jgi:hypothetical protein
VMRRPVGSQNRAPRSTLQDIFWLDSAGRESLQAMLS